MTNTDGTAPATKPASKKNATATEPANAAPAAETVAAPVAPATTTVATRPGIGRGILIGAIAASLVGGIALGGGAGALIATAGGHHGRPDFSQGQLPGGPQGQQGQGQQGQGQQGPGQQGPGQQGPGQQGPGQGQNGGMPGQPPQGGQSPQTGSGSSDGSTDGSTDGSN
jgi:hypothetical protein